MVADAEPLEADHSAQLLQWRHAVRLYALSRRPEMAWVSPRVRRSAWLLALVLHLVLIGIVRLQWVPPRPEPDTSVIQVQLFDTPADAPELPQPSFIPQRHATIPMRHDLPQNRLTLPAPSPSLAPPASDELPDVRAYNPDGSVNVPDDFAEQLDKARPKPDFIPLTVAPSLLLAAKRPLKVRPNHFAQYWNGTDGMPLHESVWRYVTASKEFVAPWGGRYGCTWILILVACADIPEKAWNPPQAWKPATQLDER